MEFFREYEFNCKCGKCKEGYMEMSKTFLYMLDRARKISDCPYVINSAMRCKKHNRDIGGKPESEHLSGHAVDISTPNSRTRFRVLYGLIQAGFTRIGIGPDFIHAGNMINKDQEVLWLY